MNQVAPSDEIPPPLAPPYLDRRTGLILFGTLEIFLGILCLLMAGFMIFGQMMLAQNTGTPTDLRMMLPAMIFYAGLAVVFFWLGIGSVRCRRWARALSLILAWMWLGMGLFMIPMMAWLMSKVLASASKGQTMPTGAITMIVTVQIIFLTIFFVLLPGVMVVFYRSRHVKETCTARDPVTRWTDACPLPVLAVACLASSGAVLMFGLPLTGLAMFPFFGVLLTGFPGTLLMMAAACVLFWIGRSWYRLNLAGWWAVVAMIILFGISNVLTFARVDLMDVYQKLGYPQATIDLIRQQGWMNSNFMMVSSIFWIVPMLGYLFWVKRFFRPID